MPKVEETILSESREQLGSHIEIKLPKKHSHLFEKCFNEINRIEIAYSRFKDTSELSTLNKNLGKWQKASSEYIKILEYSIKFNKKTQGAFDITLKKVLDKMGYDKDYSFNPTTLDEEALKDIAEPIMINKAKKMVLLKKEVDFGGIGKGYALDQITKILDKNKVDHYYINAGGDIYAKGKKEPWVVLLEHPDDFNKVIGKVEIREGSIACSASNRRKWKGVHHLINAKTKMPENSVKAIFVIAKTGMEADVYATSLFTSGFNHAMELYKSLPVEILMISPENKVFKSDGFKVEFL